MFYNLAIQKMFYKPKSQSLSLPGSSLMVRSGSHSLPSYGANKSEQWSMAFTLLQCFQTNSGCQYKSPSSNLKIIVSITPCFWWGVSFRTNLNQIIHILVLKGVNVSKNKLIFLYLKTRCCKYCTLNITLKTL